MSVDSRGGAEPGQNIRAVIESLFQDEKSNEIANVLLNVVHEFTSHSDYKMRACALSALKTLGVNPQWLDEALPRVVAYGFFALIVQYKYNTNRSTVRYCRS